MRCHVFPPSDVEKTPASRLRQPWSLSLQLVYARSALTLAWARDACARGTANPCSEPSNNRPPAMLGGANAATPSGALYRSAPERASYPRSVDFAPPTAPSQTTFPATVGDPCSVTSGIGRVHETCALLQPSTATFTSAADVTTKTDCVPGSNTGCERSGWSTEAGCTTRSEY